jgi:hypothetical protein
MDVLNNNKMFRLLGILCIAIVIVFAHSCTPKYYFPTMQNVPLLTESSEIQATSNFTFTSASINLAGSPVKHLGLQVNLARIYSPAFGNGFSGRQSLKEFGVGFYSKVYNAFTIESYLIGAMGHSVNNTSSHIGDYDTLVPAQSISTSFRRNGVQLNLGFKFPHGILGFGFKFSRLHFYNINGDLVYEGIHQFQYLSQNNNMWLMEPAFTYRMGGERLQFSTQVCLSNNLTKSDFHQSKLQLGVGLNFNFVIKKKKLPYSGSFLMIQN